jgi:group I intron endonuclease
MVRRYTMIIYKATNTITNKSYIGQTIQGLHKRRYYHERNYDGEKSYFQLSIQKYGKENFQWEILCECSTSDEMNEKEMYYIREHNTIRPFGYNLTLGGEGSYWTGGNNPAKLSHVREKISKKNKGRKRPDMTNYNKECTGMTYYERFGEEMAQKILEKKSLSAINNGLVGRYERSQDTKDKLGRTQSSYIYKIYDSDILIYETYSTSKVMDFTGIPKPTILWNFKRKGNLFDYKGYRFERIPLVVCN